MLWLIASILVALPVNYDWVMWHISNSLVAMAVVNTLAAVMLGTSAVLVITSIVAALLDIVLRIGIRWPALGWTMGICAGLSVVVVGFME